MNRLAPLLANALTLLFAALTAAVAVGTLAIAGDAMEPPFLKPATEPPPTAAALPTALPASPTLAVMLLPTQGAASIPVPTGTPTITPLPSPTPSPDSASLPVPSAIPATATRTPLPTLGRGLPTLTPTATLTWTPSPTSSPPPLGPSPTPTPVLPFILQPGTPLLRPNFANTEGCSWQGIAGLVVDELGNPVKGVQVLVTGETIGDQTRTSGSRTSYGESGWEVVVGNTIDNGRFLVMLAAQDGTPLSPVVEIIFPAACEQNLALVNFVQIRPF